MKIMFFPIFAVLICCSFNSLSQEQYYTASLEGQELTVFAEGQGQTPFTEDQSQINWGRVDFDEVKLFRITSSKGYAEFTLESGGSTNVLDASVGLALWDNNNFDDVNIFFGFKFSQTNFQIVANDAIVDIQLDNDSYVFGTTFRIEKCVNNINYYKDDELIYSYCGNTDVGNLFQFTSVENSINPSTLYLNFHESVMDCNDFNLVGAGNNNSFRSSTVIESGSPAELLDQLVEPNKYIYIKIVDQDGKYIRQFKKRSNSKGVILGCDEVKNLLQKSGYDVNIVVAD